MIRRSRLPFILLAFISLVFGLWTGLTRMGWNFNLSQPSVHHGAIMVGGFLGTLISLEKIIPLRKNFLYLIPTTSAASVVLFLAGLSQYSLVLLILAATGLSGVFLLYLLKERNLIYGLMAAGAVCWLVGNVLLVTKNFYPLAFPWWLGFALLIITAERLELMKFLPVGPLTKLLLVLLLSSYIAGVCLSFHGPGNEISGGALIGVALWLLRYDLISISIKKQGLLRFVAVALFAGYLAMLLTGVFFLALRGQAMAYDAIVHIFFIGFVLSMIFAHGPIILPGVLGISAKPFHLLLYGWLILLHTSWILRTIGDISLDFQLRNPSGMVTAVAILGYFATLATLTMRSVRQNEKIL